MNPEQETIYCGLSHAAWGYFFLHFDFNLGTVSIFPRFVGFLLLLSAIRKLSGGRRDLSLLRPLAILLAAWHALDWLVSWGGGDLDGHLLCFDLLIAVVGLYFHFQFLTDMAALAEQYQPEEADLGGQLCRRRTVYIVLVTAASLIGNLPAGLRGSWMEWMAFGMALVAMAAAVMIMAALFRLRRYFGAAEAA